VPDQITRNFVSTIVIGPREISSDAVFRAKLATNASQKREEAARSAQTEPIPEADYGI